MNYVNIYKFLRGNGLTINRLDRVNKTKSSWPKGGNETLQHLVM